MPMEEITRPLVVVGERLAAAKLPDVVRLPKAVARPAVLSYGADAAPRTSNRTAVEPDISVPLVERLGPVRVVRVAAPAA
jgi:hypothetical protein